MARVEVAGFAIRGPIDPLARGGAMGEQATLASSAKKLNHAIAPTITVDVRKDLCNPEAIRARFKGGCPSFEEGGQA